MKTTDLYDKTIANPPATKSTVESAVKSGINLQHDTDRRLILEKIRNLLVWASEQ
ncbi:hypothetical protein ON006_00245 [Dyadobacter pollutisoli]|uniref:Uncharacterized protein n=1 Tax=Dyadobacter pollutisoli TaxID=2910158 RepID=A0A9E8NCD9_9BACT|nr:hypothetical protein [Dyadobacter pollutisoli]WAC12396.1 hypothetical protein ON006_00245 [Dyadobacter pollutisoli]